MKKEFEKLPLPSDIEISKDENHLTKINDKWNELREIASVDLQDPPVNDFNLPSINIKWLGFRSDWVRAYIDIVKIKEKIERQLLIEYRVYSDIKYSKEEESLMIRTDPRFMRAHEKCERISGLLQYIDSILNAIQNKYYLIKEYNIRQRYLKGSLD